MNSDYKRLIIAVSVLLFIIIIFYLYLYWPILTGAEAVLATRPVDPFDPFRGQYLTIGYEIGSLPAISGVTVGDKIYTLLQDDEKGVARFKSASINKPSSGLFISGEVERLNGENLTIKYGIEQYFFERDAHLSAVNQVKVKISSDGKARITELLNNGNPVEIQYRNVSLKS